jgi:hypothetical protein
MALDPIGYLIYQEEIVLQGWEEFPQLPVVRLTEVVAAAGMGA